MVEARLAAPEGELIETLEGIMRANPGDMVIKGLVGELYPCKADVFKETYEALD